MEAAIAMADRIAEGIAVAPIDEYRPAFSNIRGFALLVALWWLGKQKPDSLYKGAIVIAGGSDVVERLDRISKLWPSVLDRFLLDMEYARKPADIVNAAVYLTMAITDLKKSGVWDFVSAWLKKPEVVAVMDSLDRRYPKATVKKVAASAVPVPSAEERTATYLASLGWDESAIKKALNRA